MKNNIYTSIAAKSILSAILLAATVHYSYADSHRAPYIGYKINLGSEWSDISGNNLFGDYVDEGGSEGYLSQGIVLGVKDLVQFNDRLGLRLEAEYYGNRSTVGEYTTDNSVYVNEAGYYHDTKAGFANLWLDYDIKNSPFAWFIGGGVGVAQHNILVNDNITSANNDELTFAYHIGTGITAAVGNGVEFVAGVRYLNLGKTATELSTNLYTDTNGNFLSAPAGSLELEHQAVEAWVGVNISFHAIKNLFKNN